jgi:hypothetical protein
MRYEGIDPMQREPRCNIPNVALMGGKVAKE